MSGVLDPIAGRRTGLWYAGRSPAVMSEEGVSPDSRHSCDCTSPSTLWFKEGALLSSRAVEALVIVCGVAIAGVSVNQVGDVQITPASGRLTVVRAGRNKRHHWQWITLLVWRSLLCSVLSGSQRFCPRALA
jgi:hypothetical protein